jgi:hypothetical protein
MLQLKLRESLHGKKKKKSEVTRASHDNRFYLETYCEQRGMCLLKDEILSMGGVDI